jgi:REP element-mobilizing transposase RayT
MFQKRSEESKPMRWKKWDYSNGGYYFVTLCTKDREEFFGEIRNGIMGLNELGITANQCWLDIPRHFDGVELDEYVVMPNHVHGVIGIDGVIVDAGCEKNGGLSVGDADHVNNGGITVGDADLRPLRNKTKHPKNLRPTENQTDRSKMVLSKIIHGFKSTVTRIIQKQFPDFNFAWQRSYHDRIIRNEKELNAIRRYIINNPIHWELDRNNPGYFF